MLNILSQYIYPISSFGIYPECTKKDKNKMCQDSSSPNILIQDTSELRELILMPDTLQWNILMELFV